METFNKEEFRKQFAPGLAALAQGKKDKDGNTRFFNVYGDVHDGIDHSLNVFIDVNNLGVLCAAALNSKLKVPEKKNEDSDYKGAQITVDLTDLPATWILYYDKTNMLLERYLRDSSKGCYKPTEKRSIATGEEGRVSFDYDTLLKDHELLRLFVFISLRKHLMAEGVVQQLRDMKKYSAAGVLVTAKREGDISYRIVQGRERPDLMCYMPLGDSILCRPYLDEMIGLSDDESLSGNDLIELEKKAESGDSVAQAKLASRLMGLGNESGYEEAEDLYKDSLKWANRAAESNEAEAYCVLALAYQHGRGVDTDREKAAEYYRLSADGGYALAQLNLGSYLHERREYSEAVRWFRLAADQGNASAMYNLGRCYQFAQGVEYNMTTAIEWYDRYLELVDNPEVARKVAVFKTLPDLGDGNKNGFEIKGKSFVHTGLSPRDENRVQEIVSAGGGIIKSSVVLSTDYLIYDEKDGLDTRKYHRAKELIGKGKSIKLVPVGEFFSLIEGKATQENKSGNNDNIIIQQENTKRVVEASFSEVESFRDSIKRKCDQLVREWDHQMDELQYEAAGMQIESEWELLNEMKKTIRLRNTHGLKFDELISNIDDKGEVYLNKHDKTRVIQVIQELLQYVKDESESLNISFGTTGVDRVDLGEEEFCFSRHSQDVIKKWQNKNRQSEAGSKQHYLQEERKKILNQQSEWEALLKQTENNEAASITASVKESDTLSNQRKEGVEERPAGFTRFSDSYMSEQEETDTIILSALKGLGSPRKVRVISDYVNMSPQAVMAAVKRLVKAGKVIQKDFEGLTFYEYCWGAHEDAGNITSGIRNETPRADDSLQSQTNTKEEAVEQGKDNNSYTDKKILAVLATYGEAVDIKTIAEVARFTEEETMSRLQQMSFDGRVSTTEANGVRLYSYERGLSDTVLNKIRLGKERSPMRG